MTTFVISLPSIDTRPTAQWYQWAKTYIIENHRKDVLLLGGPAPFKVGPTEFLNYRDYFTYVYPQLIIALNRAKNGDTVFFMDGETAGVEAIEYVRKMEKVDIKIKTFWHSGTYDRNDLPFIRGVHGEHFERGWFDITDRVYVASEYHKQVLTKERNVPSEKITVTGCPVDLEALHDGAKTQKVRRFLYAARKVAEKGYDVVEYLRNEGIPVTVSLDEGWDKATYYKEIARSEMLLNPSRHELFGTAIMEAFASNVPVITPDLPTFRTVVPAKYRVPYEAFFNMEAFLGHVRAILKNPEDMREIVRPYEFRSVMSRWFEE